MSRTTRKRAAQIVLSTGRFWLRRPKGSKQALSTGARSVPPNDWDDLMLSHEVIRALSRMRKDAR